MQRRATQNILRVHLRPPTNQYIHEPNEPEPRRVVQGRPAHLVKPVDVAVLVQQETHDLDDAILHGTT
eukprot:CAMPEP_0118637298 /NCGR_PEP_ID=MMETSP0785-20121206/3078_1 /TAXON_ID=91992 /ORGANISM="Bolidomonas pacifica, Strain CCMP 1866" /LENGTH=67 /DNA_ID=CAMNT_0006528475 /DNA_START=125 /DNA_END=328 /DNA_ORIENTATION=+